MKPQGDPFYRHVLTLLLGNGIAQAVPILASFAIARIYSPAQMGVYALYLLLPTNLAVLATGRYDLAVVLPKRDEDGLNLVALCALIASAFALVTLLLVVGLRGPLSAWLGEPKAAELLLLAPLSVWLTGATQAAFAWLNRKKAYRFLSIAKTFQSIAGVAVTLLLGFFGYGLSGLVLGSVAGQVAAALGAVAYFRMTRDAAWSSLSWRDVKRNAIEHKDFPKVNSLHVLLDLLQANFVTLGIERGFGPAALGHYSFTMRVLRTPLGLIASALGQVFYQRASELEHEHGDVRGLMRGVVVQLGALGVPIFVVLLAFGPALFVLAFGPNWHDAGSYARILSPFIVLNFVASPIAPVYALKGRQRAALAIGITDFLAKVAALGVGLLHHSIEIALFGMSIAGTVIVVYGIHWSFGIAGVPAREQRHA